MVVLSESSPPATTARRNGSMLACGLLVLAVLASALREHNAALAVYLLSFWHYYLYWLACAFGAPSFEVFKRDAVTMKVVSVAVLAIVYLSYPLDVVSLSVIAAGSLLNMRAAAALGVDRTYYGYELAGLPPRRITSFPYSLTSHPMILGNVAAFGGTLLNPAFREAWAPLAGLHVALNIGLLAMELAGPQRRNLVRSAGTFVFTLLLAGGPLCFLAAVPAAAALLGAACIVCAGVLYRCYAPSPIREETS
jgi:hypothetical protein